MIVHATRFGTASALRQIADSLGRSDFFVVSGDVICSVPFQYLADIHRSKNSSLVALLTDSTALKPGEIATAKQKKEEQGDLDTQFIGLDSANHNNNRLIFYKSVADVEDELKLRKSLLLRHTNVTIHTKYRDCHVYLFSNWVLNVLRAKKIIASIQKELLPYLVKNQFCENFKQYFPENAENHSFQQLAYDLSHSSALVSAKNEIYLCHAYVAPSSSFVSRANSLASYKALNHELVQLDYEHNSYPWANIASDNTVNNMQRLFSKATLAQNTVTSEQLKLGDNVAVKRSVIGRNVKIAAGTKITNSIIMDNANIEDNCTITDSIVCSGAIINKGTTLKDSKVGPNFSVNTAEYKNEILCSEQGED
jgi:translation initiation factor eIF-2B subunit gamma